jgi:hypothetical protein
MMNLFAKFLMMTGIIVLILGLIGLLISSKSEVISPVHENYMVVRSIDTMKSSRDNAREKLQDPAYDVTISQMVKDIKATGATHVAIGTPYDEEFVPYLTRWVNAAREQNLNVWFRGNFSGWEEWFEYELITRAEHKVLLESFLTNNPQLFEDGDIFSPCPECENGGSGDPRETRDVEGFRKFLIEETAIADNVFSDQKVNVRANFHSMNGDVAKLIMDKKTTEALGGIMVVDHYVSSPTQLAEDIKEYAELSGGQVVLGEFGAPIPDLQGKMTEAEQAAWLNETFTLLKDDPNLIGVNYWVNKGGSTALWNEDGSPREAVSIMKKFFTFTRTDSL